MVGQDVALPAGQASVVDPHEVARLARHELGECGVRAHDRGVDGQGRHADGGPVEEGPKSFVVLVEDGLLPRREVHLRGVRLVPGHLGRGRSADGGRRLQVQRPDQTIGQLIERDGLLDEVDRAQLLDLRHQVGFPRSR